MLFLNWVNQSLTKNYLLKQKFIGGGVVVSSFAVIARIVITILTFLKPKVSDKVYESHFSSTTEKLNYSYSRHIPEPLNFVAPCISSREIHSSICAYFKLSTDFRCFSLILFDETIKHLINFGFIRVLKIK